MPLPVPPDTMRVRLRATLGDGALPQEEAQFGFWGVLQHFIGNTVDWQSNVDEMAVKVRDAWNTAVTNKGFYGTTVRMESVTVDHLDAANGKTLEQGVAPFTGSDAWAGSASASLPWETTVAVSLYGYAEGAFATNKARKRGRFYLPPMAPGVLVGQTGQLGGAALDGTSANMGAFLNAVQGAELGDDGGELNTDYFDLRVISRGTPLKPLPPTSTQIIRVTVDSKIDAQRRRERQQDPDGLRSVEIEHAN